jgi:uncharacterized protein YodC (DUF2158 family)
MSASAITYVAGTVIALKSGGPAVTVLSRDGDMVKGIFFSDEIGEFREVSLPVIAIEAVDPEDLEDDDASEDEDGSDNEDEEGDEDQPGSRRS